MSKKHHILEDLAKLFESLLSNAANLKHEARQSFTNKFEEIIKRMDLVNQTDLAAVRKLAQKNSKEIAELKKELKIKEKKDGK